MQLNKQELLKLYPEYDNVLGPYKRKDGRQHVVLNNSNLPKGSKGKLKTVSYPKALVESVNQFRLSRNETIDHHDRDKTNDSLDNLKIKNKSLHCSEDAKRVRVTQVTCAYCSNTFIPSKNQIYTTNNIAGPFCSKHCSGKYGTDIQKGLKPIKRNEVKTEHYFIDKTL